MCENINQNFYATEGLTSNFFIIDENYTFHTAPNNFALEGCISKIVKII
jgi:branched-subunit amino acid aminotransferase/4-amino-4-deoxychorismate lyase